MVEPANEKWVDCSGSVGGSMGVSWVLLRQWNVVDKPLDFMQQNIYIQ